LPKSFPIDITVALRTPRLSLSLSFKVSFLNRSLCAATAPWATQRRTGYVGPAQVTLD
jgi:hypothetical protein